MSRKHRLVIVSLFHPEIIRGGAQQVAYNLFCEARRDDDIEATLLCACDPDYNPKLVKSGAYITGFNGRDDEHLFFGHGFDFFLQRPTNPHAVERFREFLRETSPDTIHFHHTLFMGAPMMNVVRQECPSACIAFTMHEFIPICHANGQMVRTNGGGLCGESSPYRCHQCFPDIMPDAFMLRRQFLLRAFEDVDVFIAPTELVRERYREWGIDAQRIHVIPNGQPTIPPLRPRVCGDAPAQRRRFGFFGQFVDNKGLHILLEAAKILVASEETEFAIEIHGANLEFATAEYRERLKVVQDELDELGFRDVHYRGAYDHSQLAVLMERVDWVVVPSTWWEIFGLVVSEGWAYGKPVIVSDIGGLRERVEHNHNGLLFPPGDAGALAETMRRCMEEDGLWDALRANCRPEMTSHESWLAHRQRFHLSSSDESHRAR